MKAVKNSVKLPDGFSHDRPTMDPWEKLTAYKAMLRAGVDDITCTDVLGRDKKVDMHMLVGADLQNLLLREPKVSSQTSMPPTTFVVQELTPLTASSLPPPLAHKRVMKKQAIKFIELCNVEDVRIGRPDEAEKKTILSQMPLSSSMSAGTGGGGWARLKNVTKFVSGASSASAARALAARSIYVVSRQAKNSVILELTDPDVALKWATALQLIMENKKRKPRRTSHLVAGAEHGKRSSGGHRRELSRLEKLTLAVATPKQGLASKGQTGLASALGLTEVEEVEGEDEDESSAAPALAPVADAGQRSGDDEDDGESADAARARLRALSSARQGKKRRNPRAAAARTRDGQGRTRAPTNSRETHLRVERAETES